MEQPTTYKIPTLDFLVKSQEGEGNWEAYDFIIKIGKSTDHYAKVRRNRYLWNVQCLPTTTLEWNFDKA